LSRAQHRWNQLADNFLMAAGVIPSQWSYINWIKLIIVEDEDQPNWWLVSHRTDNTVLFCLHCFSRPIMYLDPIVSSNYNIHTHTHAHTRLHLMRNSFPSQIYFVLPSTVWVAFVIHTRLLLN
jgi:hypothetical protein